MPGQGRLGLLMRSDTRPSSPPRSACRAPHARLRARRRRRRRPAGSSRARGRQLVHVIHDDVVAKTLPCPVPPEQRRRLRGARLAEQPLPPPPAGPVHLERRVPTDGVVMVTLQRLRVGRAHAGKTITIIVETPTSASFTTARTQPPPANHNAAGHPVPRLRTPQPGG